MSLIPNDGTGTNGKNDSTSTSLTNCTPGVASQDSESVSAWLEMMEKNNPPLPTPSAEEFEPSSDITQTLSPRQKQWLKWCLDQEASKIRGGIFNNQDALMNKIQAITLVVTARDHFEGSEATSSSLDRCTLLICPSKVSLEDWKKNIENTVKRKDTVLVFDGADGPTTEEIDFKKYDFVICTKATVLSETRIDLSTSDDKETSQTSQQAQNEEKGEIHTKKKAKVIVPMLFSGTWGRIILDEPRLGDSKKNMFNSILKLKSHCKWAIYSSFPLRDRLDVMYPLIRFLDIFPYAYFVCMDCDCKNQEHRFAEVCNVCGHSMSMHCRFWRKYIEARMQPDVATAERLQLKERAFRTVLFEPN